MAAAIWFALGRDELGELDAPEVLDDLVGRGFTATGVLGRAAATCCCLTFNSWLFWAN